MSNVCPTPAAAQLAALKENFSDVVEELNALLKDNRALHAENQELRDKLAKYKYDTWHLKMLRSSEKQTHGA